MLKKTMEKIIILILNILLIIVSNSIFAYATDGIENKNKTTPVISENSNKLVESKVINEGYYIIKSALDLNMVLDIDKVSKDNEANIQLWSRNGGTNQIFEIIYDENTTAYKIKSP